MTDEQIKVNVVNILDSGSGFAIETKEPFRSVFLPQKVTSISKVRMGDVVHAIVVPNAYDRDGRTPLMALMARFLSHDMPASVENNDVTDRVMNALADGYLSTSELASELGMDSQMVSHILAQMFADGMIVKAEIHQRPNQKRASMLLWATDVNKFLEA